MLFKILLVVSSLIPLVVFLDLKEQIFKALIYLLVFYLCVYLLHTFVPLLFFKRVWFLILPLLLPFLIAGISRFFRKRT